MKAIKNVLTGKGLPKRGEKGFTLVELLIVLAILAVLAAVVIPSVTGMFGRGAAQSYATDGKTILSGVMAYMMDIRDGGIPADAGHYIPTKGTAPTAATTDVTLGIKSGNNLELLKLSVGALPADEDAVHPGNYRLYAQTWNGSVWSAAAGITDTQVPLCAIWMTWLAEKYLTDPGPYLSEIPKSSGGTATNNNAKPGSYVWVVSYDGQVYGIYGDGAVTQKWYVGSMGSYP